jgi:hypothetical protein
MFKKIGEAFLSFRFWIIRKLVGKRIVMINVTLKEGSVHIPPDGHAYIFDCHFEGPKEGAVFVMKQ